MRKAANSILVYGIYMVILGLVYLVVPNVPLALLGFPTTTQPWIRVMAVCVVILGYYYIQAVRNDVKSFFRWTVHARLFFAVCSIVFVMSGLAQPMLLIFGALELLGAGWTGLALRSS